MYRRTKKIVVCLAFALALSAFAAPAGAATLPFQTQGYTDAGIPETVTAVTGQPHTFQFWLWHPDAGAVVTSGQVIFLKHVWEGTRFHEFVTSVPISGIDGYHIETGWDYHLPENAFVWPELTLMPGQYEWAVLVTADGETNAMYDTPELTVYPPVAVDERATFTGDTAVKVSYFHRPSERYFQISNSISSWPEAWQEIPAEGHTIDWTLPQDADGATNVFMRFVDAPGGAARTWSDSICVDRSGPVTRALRPVTVSKGRTAKLTFGAMDDWSPQGTFSIEIRTAGGSLVKTLAAGTRTMSQYRFPAHVKAFTCELKRGTYRYSVLATDLAGNRQSKVGWNKLVVK